MTNYNNSFASIERDAIAHANSIRAEGAYRGMIIRDFIAAARRDANRPTPAPRTARAIPTEPPTLAEWRASRA